MNMNRSIFDQIILYKGHGFRIQDVIGITKDVEGISDTSSYERARLIVSLKNGDTLHGFMHEEETQGLWDVLDSIVIDCSTIMTRHRLDHARLLEIQQNLGKYHNLGMPPEMLEDIGAKYRESCNSPISPEDRQKMTDAKYTAAGKENPPEVNESNE